MELPERFKKYPLLSLAVIVALLLFSLYSLANIFGPDVVQSWIESLGREVVDK